MSRAYTHVTANGAHKSGEARAYQIIEASVSNATGVYYFLHPLYIKGNIHWASSSSQNSACVVEPANPDDVSKILQIVANTSTPFGIRSGGHATNPGFSSTPGVQIALFKFSEVIYRPAPAATDGSVGTVDIGSGLVWDTVYDTIEPLGINVVGGRVTGVGVGGFTLGGGYSWLSNQYGLTIDTVTSFEVVLPNGTIATATETTNPDLFFGLRGGFNNFGIGKVWGGLQTFTANRLDQVNAATADFAANVTDPKAAIITTYNFLLGQLGVSLLMFYDGLTPPAGIFERFTSIPHFTSDVTTRSFSSLTWGNLAVLKAGALISYEVEPFLPSMNKRNKGESTRVIREQAITEGQDIAGAKQIKYGNYASATDDLSSLYGPNLERLKTIKVEYDPNNIMALAGGYRF